MLTLSYQTAAFYSE